MPQKFVINENATKSNQMLHKLQIIFNLSISLFCNFLNGQKSVCLCLCRRRRRRRGTKGSEGKKQEEVKARHLKNEY